MTKTCHFAVQTINYQAFSCLSIYAVKIPIEREFFTRECLYACQPIKISAKTIELSAYQIHNNRQFFVYIWRVCAGACVNSRIKKKKKCQKNIKSSLFDYHANQTALVWAHSKHNLSKYLWISNVKRIIQV